MDRRTKCSTPHLCMTAMTGINVRPSDVSAYCTRSGRLLSSCRCSSLIVVSILSSRLRTRAVMSFAPIHVNDPHSRCGRERSVHGATCGFGILFVPTCMRVLRACSFSLRHSRGVSSVTDIRDYERNKLLVRRIVDEMFKGKLEVAA